MTWEELEQKISEMSEKQKKSRVMVLFTSDDGPEYDIFVQINSLGGDDGFAYLECPSSSLENGFRWCHVRFLREDLK